MPSYSIPNEIKELRRIIHTCPRDEFVLSMELRSVNSRFLDFSSRLPKVLMPFEDQAIRLIKKKLLRGRVTLSVKLDYMPSCGENTILDYNKLETYLELIKEIQKKTNIADKPTIGDILSLPDIFLVEHGKENLNLHDTFIDTLNNAIVATEEVRIQEGKNIQKDLCDRINKTLEVINQIEELALGVKKGYFEKYKKRIEEIISDVGIDENRICQEAAIIAEKKDITEEIIRFKSHIDLFNRYMNSDISEGKKLNFLLQEMGREVNTIGSKTDFIDVSHLVVNIKDELEKIREQVQNIV